MKINCSDISVVIPMYNSARTIVKALDSINKQYDIDYLREIIIVNDGSSDNSQEIVEDYALHSILPIKLINVKNGGVSKARNIGIKSATGKWIALCDSDDEWLPIKTRVEVSLVNTHEGIDFIGGNHFDTVQSFFFRKYNSLHKFSVKELCLKMLPQTSTALFRKDILYYTGFYDENQKYAEDGNLFLRIAALYGYYYTPEQLVRYGDGKKGFGDSGLSANIYEMHKGIKKNLKEMREKRYISFPFFIFAIFFEYLKYIRRMWLTR